MRLRKKEYVVTTMKVKRTKRIFVDGNLKKNQKCNEHDTSLLIAFFHPFFFYRKILNNDTLLLNTVSLLWNKTFMIMQLRTTIFLK